MNITEEWRIYDPTDPRTHPEGIALVALEYEDGRVQHGQYSRDTGWFTSTRVGIPVTVPPDSPIKRWRYLSKTPDV